MVLASELALKEEEKEEFDLDLTRFNTNENPNIRKDRFGLNCKMAKVNNLKEITMRN